MVDALDLLQCPVCGTWYLAIYKGALIGHHCSGDVVGYRLTEDVVDPPLTGLFLDVKV